MKRKGQYFWPIILGVVALIVIGSVAYFIGARFDPRVKTFLNFLPSFGEDNTTSVSLEALKYSVPSNNLYYYTGSDFEVIPSGSYVRLNDKYLESDVIRKAITEYYFSLDSRLFYAPLDQVLSDKKPTYRFSLAPDYKVSASIISFSSLEQATIESSSFWEGFKDYVGSSLNLYNINALKEQVPKRGDVVLALTTNEPKVVVASFIVKADNSYVYVPNDKYPKFSLSDAERADLLKQVIQWRDSVLKGGSFETTLDVPYKDKGADGASLFVTVQPEIGDEGNLIIRLGNVVPRKDSAAELKEKYGQSQTSIPVYDFAKYSLKSDGEGSFFLLYNGVDTSMIFKKMPSQSNYQYVLYMVKDHSKYLGYVSDGVIHRNALIPEAPIEEPFTKESYGHIKALAEKTFSAIPADKA